MWDIPSVITLVAYSVELMFVLLLPRGILEARACWHSMRRFEVGAHSDMTA